VSKGFMRGNPLRLASSRNGHGHNGTHANGGGASYGESPASALADAAGAMRSASAPGISGSTMQVVGTTVMKAHADTEVYSTLTVAVEPVLSKSELFKQRIADAKLRGYEGVSCPECANFTMVRNGTCLKCDTCGSTSGCS